MEYVNVKFAEEAREKVIEGVKLATNAIATTFGPNGANVLIRQKGILKSTKDGATVILNVNDPDPYIQMGIDVIKEASLKTAKEVGDGSTTVALLANEIIKTYKDVKDPIQVSRDLRNYVTSIVTELERHAKPISAKEDIFKVATLSANNDKSIGNIIAEAFDKVGKDGIVTYKESQEVKDRIEYTSGFKIENGYESPYFINDSRNNCILDNVLIYISNTKLDESKEMHDLAGKAYKEGKSLLLIAPEFGSELTMFLVRNMFNADGTPRLKSCEVISPNFGALREIMLEDMRILFGDTMECEKVVITKESTTFTGYTPNQEKLDNRLKSIRQIIDDDALCETEMVFHKKRLANFTSGIATIFVGGYSQVEMKEKCDRYEDAIMATQCAMQKGVLPGGGYALYKVASDPETLLNYITSDDYDDWEDNIDSDFYFIKPNKKINELPNDIKQILKFPHEKLFGTNLHVELKDSDEFIDDPIWYDDFGENLFDKGIIDPFLVVKATLENAVAVASTILTTQCAILND